MLNGWEDNHHTGHALQTSVMADKMEKIIQPMMQWSTAPFTFTFGNKYVVGCHFRIPCLYMGQITEPDKFQIINLLHS